MDEKNAELSAEVTAPEADLTEQPTEQAENEGEGDNSSEADELESLLKEATGEVPETEDIEYEGKTYNLPRELKEALLRQSDYTKKTMDLAEQRRAVEARQKQVEDIHNLSQDELSAAMNYQMVQQQMENLLNTNLDGLSEDQVNKLRLDFGDLERQASRWASALQEATGKRQTLHSQQLQQAREAAFSEAAKRIPNFTAERRQALEQFALERGASQDVVANLADPTVYEILHLADIGKRFIEGQRKATKVEKAQQAQPVPEVGGKKATAQKDPNRMTPEEYHKMRLKQRMA